MFYFLINISYENGLNTEKLNVPTNSAICVCLQGQFK